MKATGLGFLLLVVPPLAAAPVERWNFTELRRLPAAEARQGVAVDAQHYYAIANFAIGKFRRDTGARVDGWECEEGKPFTHLNAGTVVDGLLYCAHSNYPGVPNRSSVEIWDPVTLEHTKSVDFGETDGSLTWVERRGDGWIACFTHYGRRGGMPGRKPEDTWMAECDQDWRQRGRWDFPTELLTHLGTRGFAVSGGAIGPGGHLYVTGHDDSELYVLRFPSEGRRLEWIASVPVSAEGQAFSWDPVEPGVVHLILKRTREIITGKVELPIPRDSRFKGTCAEPFLVSVDHADTLEWRRDKCHDSTVLVAPDGIHTSAVLHAMRN